MSKALDIQLAIYASIEIARSVAYALVFTGAGSSLVKYLGTWNYLGWLDIASWLAFIVFSATAFKPLTYRWLRVIAALLVSFLLPFTVAALFVRTTSRVVPIEWMLVWLSAELIGIGAIKLAIAALIYGWSVRRASPSAQFAGS